jgi:hypothetical protein
MKLKYTAENPHGEKIIECPECKFNNCKSASDPSPECCWCHGEILGYNINEPCCFSNWKEENGIWRSIGKQPKRTREQFKLKSRNLNDLLEKMKNVEFR